VRQRQAGTLLKGPHHLQVRADAGHAT
jgi:hypothetical protein